MSTVEVNPLRILCADDDRFFRDAVTGLLESAGHRVCAAEDGHSAWDILLGEMDHIDVVVTDHQMPGFTGLELTQLLRQTTFRGRIYVYSSHLQPPDAEDYRGLHVDGIFSKKVSLAELLRVIERTGPGAAEDLPPNSHHVC